MENHAFQSDRRRFVQLLGGSPFVARALVEFQCSHSGASSACNGRRRQQRRKCSNCPPQQDLSDDGVGVPYPSGRELRY